MSISSLRSIMALSAIVALGAGQGWASLAEPADRPLSAFPAPAAGDIGPTVEGAPANPVLEPGWEGPEPAGPSKEDKTDCDDCVIVRAEPLGGGGVEEDGRTGTRTENAQAGRREGSSGLAGTLWGLFVVARPKLVPRTIIRGITVT